jgi:hypothetical protein
MAACFSISLRRASSSACLRASSSDITGFELISFLPHEGTKKATKIISKIARNAQFLWFILFSLSASKKWLLNLIGYIGSMMGCRKKRLDFGTFFTLNIYLKDRILSKKGKPKIACGNNRFFVIPSVRMIVILSRPTGELK